VGAQSCCCVVGAAGAAAGALTDEDQIDLGKPIWK
jgi:hypothetical protein